MISTWEGKTRQLQQLIMKPMTFNDLCLTVIDIVSARHSKDFIVAPHRHPWFEFNYLSEGELYTTVGEHEFMASAGQFFLIPPGVFHSHRHSNYQGDDGFCLRWQLSEMLLSPESPHNKIASDIIATLSVPRPYSITVDCSKFIEAVQNHHGAALQLDFMQWIISLYDLWGAKENVKTKRNDHESILVNTAILYLEEYFYNALNVEDVANSLHVSYRHLARIFKRITGLTIVEKLNDIRMNKAQKLLIETDKPIREIAKEVGFKNEYYFSNMFNVTLYITPSQFRKKCNKSI